MTIRKPKEPEFMKELHRIREEMYKDNKKLTPRERVNRTRKEVEEFLTSHGYRLIPSNKGYRMESIEKLKYKPKRAQRFIWSAQSLSLSEK